jgi:hypothetical protein
MSMFRFSKPSMPLAFLLTALALSSGCARSYDETIAGVVIPVPNGMTRSTEKPVEMSLLGFGAGQATFHGSMDTEKIVEFYKKELPARGWQSNMNLRSGGAMLAYSKEGKTLLIGVGQQDGKTNLTLSVGGVGR